MPTKNVVVNSSWTKVAEASEDGVFVSWEYPVALEVAVTATDAAPAGTITGHIFKREDQVTRATVGAGFMWVRTVSGSTLAELSLTVSNGAAASGGGASGDVTSAGVSGASAQAVQGLDGGYPLRVNQAGVTFVNSAGNNVNVPGLANASYGQLAAGASFVGTWDDVFSQPAAQVLGDGDQPLRYTIEQAIDAAGADIVSRVEFVRARNKDLCENVQLNGNYVRVTVKNIGNASTTSFELNTTFGNLPPLPQALDNYGNLRVLASGTSNFTQKLRDAMEVWPNVSKWPNVSLAAGDLIQLEGNAIGASYLTVSLNPLAAGTETYFESDAIFTMPLDIGVGLHTSQRTLGQEMSMAVISQDESGAPASPPTDIKITSIQQATTTLTVTCIGAHGLKMGQRIGIYGVNSDSRLNYAALVVAAVPSPTQFTATAGPSGTIGSLTVGPFSPTAAYVYQRDAMSWATNGTSMVLESTTSTQASFYAKSEGGDSTPIGGTPNGAHSATIASTSTGYPVTATTGQYIGRPSTQFLLSLQADRVLWADEAIDTASQSTLRASIKQVVPNPDLLYKVRFKAANRKGLTIPNARIVSVAKTGTTTATVTTDVAHGYTTGDYVVAYGPRDQTNFANLTAATVVASTPTATTFTIIWGAAVTATSYGGFVARVQGQQVMQGQTTQVAQSYSIASSILTMVGNGTWAGVAIGDLVNIHGARVDTTGADAGIDGAYRVRDLVTTSLVLEPVGTTTIPATQASVNIGGSVIRRTDMRVSFFRLFDYERLRIETLSRPGSDAASAAPVVVQNGITAAQGTAASVGTAGAGAWIVRGAAHRTADIANAAITTVGQNNSVVIDIQGNVGTHQFYTDITALTGTAVRMFTRLQGSYDNATFFNIYDTAVQTAIANKLAGISPILPVQVPYMRYVRDLRGTTPSVSNSVTRMTRPGTETKRQRRMNDRVVGLTTTTPSTEHLWVEGCTKAQITCTPLTGATTAPTVKLQVCNGDPAVASQWYDVPSATLALSASANVASAPFDIAMPVQFARLVPTVAGVGVVVDTYELVIMAWE